MRITIEIEDGAVRATHSEGTGQREAANAGGPPAELLQLLGARPRLALQAAAEGPVNVGGPPEELLRALAAPQAGRATAAPAPAQLDPRAV
jgi:hypothetical protein